VAHNNDICDEMATEYASTSFMPDIKLILTKLKEWTKMTSRKLCMHLRDKHEKMD